MTLMTRMTQIDDGLKEAELTRSIIGGFFEVYNALGYGFLEAPYCNAFEIELRTRGHRVVRELGIAITYKGETVGRYRADMVVDRKVLVEVKASPIITVADHRQVQNYQRAIGVPVALLFHFGPEPRFYRTILKRSASSASSASSADHVDGIVPESDERPAH